MPPPPGGWRAQEWISHTIPVLDSSYSFPMSTPWDAMDRLELYYSNPLAGLQHGVLARNRVGVTIDSVRLRNIYLRSRRSFGSSSRSRFPFSPSHADQAATVGSGRSPPARLVR